MRRAARADRNQPEVVTLLRRLGASVQHLHTIGKGCPDILVGAYGRNWLVEIKDDTLPKSGQALTEDEADWHRAWKGQICVVRNLDEAIEQMNQMARMA